MSSDEYLTYAEQNRKEWEQRGEEICKSMKERCETAEVKSDSAAQHWDMAEQGEHDEKSDVGVTEEAEIPVHPLEQGRIGDI